MWLFILEDACPAHDSHQGRNYLNYKGSSSPEGVIFNEVVWIGVENLLDPICRFWSGEVGSSCGDSKDKEAAVIGFPLLTIEFFLSENKNPIEQPGRSDHGEMNNHDMYPICNHLYSFLKGSRNLILPRRC